MEIENNFNSVENTMDISELTNNFTRLLRIDDLKTNTKLWWGGNGVGDRWMNKKFNYSVLYSNNTQCNYSECANDKIPDCIILDCNIEHHSRGIKGIFVHSIRKNIQKRPIKASIKREIKKRCCVVCGTFSNIVCDHKNDFYNNDLVLNVKTQKISDFQALCNHCNLKKRQVFKEERQNEKFYSAKNLDGYKIYPFEFPWEKMSYESKCKIGTFWYDPIDFQEKIHLYSTQTIPILNELKKGIIKLTMEVKNMEGIAYLNTVQDLSVNLILTDPPYIISRETGMNKHYNNVKDSDGDDVKTSMEWDEYKAKENIENNDKMNNYLQYGSIYGKKYCVKTDYGDWDKDFTLIKLESFVAEFYKKLVKGGTLIIFFDLWKVSYLKEILERNKFKQIRFIEWIKTNPQPLNSSLNYLTNSREIALCAVKGGKPTFNSKYDSGIYRYPIQGGKGRFHPTQKNTELFQDLILKHSNKGDLVLDTFLGSGTTMVACKNTCRRFKGCEISSEYYKKMMERVEINDSKP